VLKKKREKSNIGKQKSDWRPSTSKRAKRKNDGAEMQIVFVKEEYSKNGLHVKKKVEGQGASGSTITK